MFSFRPNLIVTFVGCVLIICGGCTCTTTVNAQASQAPLRTIETPARIVEQLITATTAVERTIILHEDGEFVFDFLNPPVTTTTSTGDGGHTVAANRGVFPALVGNGIAMTIGFLGPCGLNSPHTHPRATEINFIVNGTVTAGMLLENGARFVTNTVKAGQATVFPKGAIHFEQNLGCEPIIFVAAFNDEDPGVSQIAQRFFSLPAEILGPTLGGIGVQVLDDLKNNLPDNVVLGLEECRNRCGV